MEQTSSKLPIFKYAKSFILGVLPFVLIGVISAAGVFLYAKKHPQVLGIQAPTATTTQEVDDTVKDVSKFMTLPSDETPTLATVTDTEKLQTQAFFKNAKNGDKLLLYPKSQKAILYRGSEKKIIEVGYLSATSSAQQNLDASSSAQTGQ